MVGHVIPERQVGDRFQGCDAAKPVLSEQNGETHRCEKEVTREHGVSRLGKSAGHLGNQVTIH